MLTAALGARRQRLRPHGFASRLLTRLSTAIVAHVPRSLGTGFIDYSAGRLLPGHAFAAALAAVVALVYAIGYVALSPAWSWSVAGRVPSIGYLLFLLTAAGWALSSVAFFLDRYRLSTIVLVIAWLAVTASIASTDHYFPVGDRIAAGATPRAALLAANAHYGEQPTADGHNRVVLVMSEGQGLISSAWTARVLTELAGHDTSGTAFTKSLRLLSASSGAAVGTMYFVNEYTKDGFLFGSLGAIRNDAGSSSSGEGGWGIIYPDFIRTFAPLLVPKTIDRGWAMEQVWRRPFLRDADATEPMLSRWRDDVRAGWRPAMAFGATIIETGEHALVATYDARSEAVTGRHDISLVTAARLSASFPFISPPARPEPREDNRDVPAYHVLDSGVSDNSGWTAVREWLRATQDDLMNTDIMLLDIRSLPAGQPGGGNRDKAWQLDVTGSLQAVLEGRNARHRLVSSDIAVFNEAWKKSGHTGIRHVVFALDDAGAPLTWNLGNADRARVDSAWSRNAMSAGTVSQFVIGAN
jgi:hypothetical protein